MIDRILAFDQGNESLKAALSEGGAITGKWRSVDASAIIERTDPGMIVFSSVVPESSERIREAACAAGVARIVEITFDMGMPFEILVESPGKIGPDRLCAACGVIAGGVRQAVIVDAGTAVTVDLLDSSGFRGGSIFPGAGLLAAALREGTAALPHVDLQESPGDLPGLNTAEAIRKGIHWGLIGAVTGLVNKTLEVTGTELPLFLTGGGAEMLQPHLDPGVVLDPDLVLKGIFYLAGRAAE